MKINEVVRYTLRKDYRDLKNSPVLPSRSDLDNTAYDDQTELIRSAMRPTVSRPRVEPAYLLPNDITVQQQQFLQKFQQEAVERGYTPASNQGKWKEPYIRTKNGVFLKLVIGTNKISRFYFNVGNQESKDSVKNELSLANYELPERSSGTSEISITVPIQYQSYKSALNSFWQVAKIIEDMGPNFVVHRRRQKSNQNVMPLYLKIASLLYAAYAHNASELYSRAFGMADDDDKLMAVGYTPNAKIIAKKIQELKNQGADESEVKKIRKPYREHAVPVVVLTNAAEDIYSNRNIQKYQTMYPNKKLSEEDIRWLKIYEVAKIFQRNLVIVYTDEKKDTKDHLDRLYKQTMPSGWNPQTGDVLERFRVCGIPVYPLSGGNRLAED